MKLRKIFAALAAAVVTALSAVPVYAAPDGQATYCFDNGNALIDWQTFGSVTETGFNISPTTAVSKNGNGSLVVSVAVTEENISEQFGGAYIDAATLGLENFKGCTVEMSVMLCEGAEGFYDNFALYTDGIIWLTSVPGTLSTEQWTTLSLTVPEDAANSKIGFTIPTYLLHSGNILYIDDFVVTDSTGTVIANRGDYVLKEVTSIDKTSTGTNVILTIVLVVLIIAIIGGIGLVVSIMIKRFS